jgi:uncharacterized protein
MASDYETFWRFQTYAIVGHSDKKPFPRLTYSGLKKIGKLVYPVDPSATEIAGDRAYPDLQSLPGKIDAVVLELPKEETAAWVKKVAEAGITELWMHMNSDTPEAVAFAKEKGIHARTGTCAVMYVTPGFTYHSLHKWIMKAIGKF